MTAEQVVKIIHEVLKERVGAALGHPGEASCIRVTPAVVAVVAKVLREVADNSQDAEWLVHRLAHELQELADVPGLLVDVVGRDVAVETR